MIDRRTSRCLAARITATVALGLVLAGVTTPIRAQDPTGKEPDHTRTAKAIEKLDAWPKLGKQETKRVLACMKQFRKDKQKLRDGARDRIVALGAGAAPLVLRQVNDRADNINEQLFAVLDAILKPAHGSLMARELKKPSFELRLYLVRRLAKFHDRDLIPVLQRTAKEKDKAPEIAFHAALGLLGLRQRDALDLVLEYSKAHWQDVGDDVAAVLPPARSAPVGNWVFETINKRGAADQMAGLRLVRYLGTKDHNVILKRYLQASQHPVKKAAINALRMIHGEKPLEKLSVFQVIDHAKKWMGKI